jgi:hypothetical protein
MGGWRWWIELVVPRLGFAAALPIITILTGCSLADTLRARLAGGASPHQEYANGLIDAGLAETPTGRAWLETAGFALASPRSVELPFNEEGWLEPDRADALGLRFDVPAQRWVMVRINLEEPDSARVFIDAFRVPQDPMDSLEAIASARDTSNQLTFRMRRRGTVVVRVQPELLRGGPYQLTVTAEDSPPVTRADTFPAEPQSRMGRRE